MAHRFARAHAPLHARTSLAFTFATLLIVTSGLTGCGIHGSGAPGAAGTLQMQGTVMGGQQPIAGAEIELWVAGTGGNGTAATNFTHANGLSYTTTDSNGHFSLAGDFTCPAVSGNYVPQVYVVSVGGNAGQPGTVNNTSSVLMDAIGPCSNLTSSYTLTINEVTTVAAAWALAPFMTSYTNVASSATNGTGISNAFLNAQLLADPSLGVSPGSSLPAGNTIDSGKLYALADVIATCVNSDGTTACQNLFQTIGECVSTCASDTLSAALYVVKHPAVKVSNTFGLIPTNQPYSTTLTLPPHDWTMNMTVTGHGLMMPTELAVDTAGNVWVADYADGVSVLGPQGGTVNGASYFTTPYGELYGLTVDTNNNVWAAVEELPGNSGSISGLYGITSGQTLGSAITTFQNTNVYFPESLASAPNGQILVGNYGDSTGSSFTYNYTANAPVFSLANVGYGYSSEPTDVSGDQNGGIWLADEGGYTVTHVDSGSSLVSHPNCCSEANGIATDSSGNAWIGNYGSASISEVAPGCDTNAYSSAACYASRGNVILLNQVKIAGVNYPSKVVIDAAQTVWVANYHGQTISEIAGTGSSLGAGTGISPASTYDANGNLTTQGGYGLDADLLEPFDLALDASGNVWVTNEGNNDVVMFFGLATPTATPKVPTPAAP